MGSNILTFESVFKEWDIRFIPSSGQYKMMCPFRDNHSPSAMGYESFFITPDINAYHCFSCKEKGVLTKLLTSNKFKVGLFDAYDLVGMGNLDRYLKEPDKKERTVIEVVTENVIPQEYLDRGFSARVLEYFGVSKRSDPEKGDSIIIPIEDIDGCIVTLKCRNDYKGKRSFWYEPPIDKESYLYNFKNCIGNKDCVVTEGESDVWRSFQNSVRNTCAIMGGDMSEHQSKMLSIFDDVLLAFDNDYAGIEKTEWAYEILRKRTNVRIMLYDSEDPGKCGKAEWLRAYESSVDYLEYSMVMMNEIGEDYASIKKRVQSKRYKK